MIPIRLTDLEPRFVRYETRTDTWQAVDGDHATWRERGSPTKTVTGPREYSIRVATLTEAQGIRFLCPVCFQENGGPVGTHGVEVAFDGRGVEPQQGSRNHAGAPSRWGVSGTDFDDLTLTPSIDIGRGDGCRWHGFVQSGVVTG